MNNQVFSRVWHIVRIPLVVILVLYVGLVIYRIPAAQERLKTQEVVKKIQAQKLTLADVMGQNLPPEPNPALKDASVEGIDANGNGIRDDVELAIFKLYPDSVPPERSGSSTRIRAAELQYAMALQNELENVFNSEIYILVLKEENRGWSCINDTIPSIIPKFNDFGELADWLKVPTNADFFNQENRSNSVIQDKRTKEVEELMFNNDARKQKRDDNFKSYMTSYSLPNNQFCDIDITTL